MYLLSKILAKEWFKSFFGAIVILFLLVSIGDIINGFLQNYAVNRIFIEYLLKMPDLMGKMLPICGLLASLFAINKLKNQAELMAILAGGFSAARIYRLFLACSLLIAFVQFLNLGYIVPGSNKVKRQEFEKSRKNESKYLARSKIGQSGFIWYKTDNYFTSFKAFDAKRNRLKDVTIYFLSENRKLDSIYKADTAEYVADKKWNLKDIKIIHSLDNTDFPKYTTAQNLFIELNENPNDFNQFESDITTLNIFELRDFIYRLQETDINSTEYEIMYNEKLSLALICIIFTLIPVSGIFNPNRRAAGLGKSIVFTLLFTIFFWAIHSGGISMANSEKIPVLVATLGIPSMFGTYILLIFLKNRKL